MAISMTIPTTTTMTAIKVITTKTKSTADNNYDDMTNKNIKRNNKEDNDDLKNDDND